MTSGASVCPMKMFAAAAKLSLPLVFITRSITHDTPATTRCRMP